MKQFKIQFLALLFIAALCTDAQSRTGGIVTGRVIDGKTGDPLPGTNVVIEQTRMGIATGVAGTFRIAGVPAGNHNLVFSYLGYRSEHLDITVENGKTSSTGAVALDVIRFELEPMIVEGARYGQARALNLQKTANNIKNVVSADQTGRFPDPNVAEAIQRVPGISITRDQGEGRYVLIRGTSPRLTSVTIDGEAIPAPEGEVRYAALDVIPADQVATIDVNKTLTSDMDADGIGGAVNLASKEAVDQTTILKATLATGYNRLVTDSNLQGSVTYGKRVGPDGSFGYMLSGSYYKTDRGSDNNEFKWASRAAGGADRPVLRDYQIRDYTFTRERLGISGVMDYRLGEQTSLNLRGIFNRFGDQEYQRRLRFRFDKGDYESLTDVRDGRVERKLKDRYEVQDIYSIQAGLNHSFPSMNTEYGLSYSYASEKEPNRRDIVFEQKKVDMLYDITDMQFPITSVTNGSDIFDPKAFSFKELELQDNLTWERNLGLRFDLDIPGNLRGFPGIVEFGGKARFKKKIRENDLRLMDGYEGDLNLARVVGESTGRAMNNKRYSVGRSPDPDQVRRLYEEEEDRFKLNSDQSREDTDPANYEATESVYAAYAQTRVNAADWSMLLGLRYEQTDLSYSGNDVILEEDGSYLSTSITRGENTYRHFFPALHLRYGIGQNTNLRMGLTRSLARPNYYDLVPYVLVDREDEELDLGNADLLPTTSVNFDLLLEHYFRSVGVISGGFFYKRLSDYIYTFEFERSGGIYDQFLVTEPRNGGRASLAGLEISWQQRFNTLPGVLGGFGIYSNYTFTNSRANVAGRSGRTQLPGQTAHVGNAALTYERDGFSGRAALNFHGAFIFFLGETADRDVYYDRHAQLDISASQRIQPKLRLFVELVNVTDSPFRLYTMNANWPIQQEFYSWWGHAGLKFDL